MLIVSSGKTDSNSIYDNIISEELTEKNSDYCVSNYHS